MADLYTTARKLERHLKGLSHHWRIHILLLLNEAGRDGLSLDDISSKLKMDIKNISHHTSKLEQAGLLDKSRRGRTVSHKLSPYGKKFVQFLSLL